VHYCVLGTVSVTCLLQSPLIQSVMFKFMHVSPSVNPRVSLTSAQWSYKRYANLHDDPTIGLWLRDTALFEQAWSIVCNGPSNWWWSSFICTWTVIFTVILRTESEHTMHGYKWKANPYEVVVGG
jgi:hypothetical protein